MQSRITERIGALTLVWAMLMACKHGTNVVPAAMPEDPLQAWTQELEENGEKPKEPTKIKVRRGY